MAGLNDHLVDGSFRSVLRGKLALLDCTFDEQVCAFLISQRLVSQRVVERQAVPVRLRNGLVVRTLVTVRLAKSRVRDFRSRRKVSGLWTRSQETSYYVYCA